LRPHKLFDSFNSPSQFTSEHDSLPVLNLP
jgi:hypothetical protein